jgi:predicted nucleic acid-binding protein
MLVYLDSLALAKRYVRERGSDRVLDRCREATEIGLSVLSCAEVVSGLNRLRREGKLEAGDYRKLKRALFLDLDGATVLGITPGVITVAVRCLELEPVRAADALHVGTARELACGLFLSSDHAQCAAAERFGLRAEIV